MAPLFDLILAHVPPPVADPEGPFRMLATTLESNPYLGRLLTGRITSGRLRANATLKALARDGLLIEQAPDHQDPGAFAASSGCRSRRPRPATSWRSPGFSKATVADTLCDPAVEAPLPAQPIDPSTIAMTFSVNDGPYAGQDGSKVTSRQIWERLRREAEGNVAIRVRESEEKDAFEVAGRGELQLAVLIETMRREGFELCVGRPRVLFQSDDDRQAAGADRGGRGRRRRGICRHRGREADLAPCRAEGHAPGRCRQDAPRLPRALPRAHRLSRRVPDRHPRHRRPQPRVPRLRALQGPDRPAPHRRAGLDGAGRVRGLRPLGPGGPRAALHRRRARRSIPA